MDRFRKLLEKNKDVINLITSSLLGFMALTVSMKSCEIADANLKVAEMSYLPVFSITSEYLEDHELIVIRNEGYHIYDIEINCEAFITFEPELASMESKPIINYYERKFLTKNSIGTLMTLKSREVDYKAVKMFISETDKFNGRFEHELVEGKTPPPFGTLDLRFFHIIELSFRTAMGNKIKKYFLLNGDEREIEILEEDAALYQRSNETGYLMLHSYDLKNVKDDIEKAVGY